MTVRLFAILSLSSVLAGSAGADPPVVIGYQRDVRPILANRCFKCHGPDLKKGGLDLQECASALKELKSGVRCARARPKR